MRKWLKIKFSARGLHELYFIRRWGGGGGGGEGGGGGGGCGGPLLEGG